MKVKFLAASIVALIGQSGFVLGAEFSNTNWQDKTMPVVLRKASAGESVDVLITVRGEPTLKMLRPDLKFEERVSAVTSNLRAVAEVTQAPLLAELKSRNIATQSLWIANVIAARLTPDQLQWVAARADVVRIESNAPFQQAIPKPESSELSREKQIEAVEPNISRVRAPEVWSAGFTGQNVVVGAQDTGYRWTHNAIKSKYRGWNGATADHNYNWHDAINADIDGASNSCGISATAPCDDNGHGTHTAGTVLGDDGAGNQVGVAPNAKWIGCRNMDAGTGRPFTYLDCFQFFLLPTDLTGNNPDPAKAPHVTTNSWGCPSSELCSISSFDTALSNSRAAGIVTVVAAGNGTSSCSSIIDPPAISGDAFSVGATNNADAIASFSLRGPVTVDGSNRLKPDISAPGVSIRSSTRTSDTSYSSAFSGTSMATPNVAGVVALMMSANPGLKGQPAAVERILRDSAFGLTSSQGCGGFSSTAIPNPTFGHGRVDAFAAMLSSGPSSSPQVAAPADVTINEDATTAVLPFTIGDFETAPALLTMTGVSSDTAIVANANVVFTGVRAHRNVQVTPLPNQFGSVTITLNATDTTPNTGGDAFVVTINPVNDRPSFAIGNMNVTATAGAMSQSSAVSGLDFGPNESAQSVLSYTVSEVSDPNNIVSGAALDASGTFTATLSGSAGTASFNAILRDNGGTANGGLDTSVAVPFTLTATSVVVIDPLFQNGFED